jgi:hypothetical protein
MNERFGYCAREFPNTRTEPCRVMQPLFQHEHPLLILPDWMHDHEQAREDLYGRWASEAQQHPVGCARELLAANLSIFSLSSHRASRPEMSRPTAQPQLWHSPTTSE